MGVERRLGKSARDELSLATLMGMERLGAPPGCCLEMGCSLPLAVAKTIISCQLLSQNEAINTGGFGCYAECECIRWRHQARPDCSQSAMLRKPPPEQVKPLHKSQLEGRPHLGHRKFHEWHGAGFIKSQSFVRRDSYNRNLRN